jgi:hypothetical protein
VKGKNEENAEEMEKGRRRDKGERMCKREGMNGRRWSQRRTQKGGRGKRDVQS